MGGGHGLGRPGRSAGGPPAPEKIAVGDWEIAPVVELRARPEYRRDLDELNDWTIVERARLGLDVLRGPLEARVVLQDARSFEVATGIPFAAAPAFGPSDGAFEAWAEAHTESIRPSFVRVGRQPITWGEGRLLGEADWSPTGRSFDAVRGRLALGDGSFELLAAVFGETDESLVLDGFGELLGARLEWAFDPLFAVEAYGLARIAQSNPSAGVGAVAVAGVADLDRAVRGQTYTGALRLHGDSRGWTWGAEGAYQLGHAEDLGMNRAAWAAAAHVADVLEGVALRPSLQLGASYASGDSGGGTYRGFDSLFPDVHTWHGAMELFAWSNEEEVSARAGIVPWTDGVAAVEYRYARLAQPDGLWRTAYLTTIGRATGNTDASLGHEIDGMVRWSPWEPVTLELGYSILFLGDGARAILAANGIGRGNANGGLSTATTSQFAYAQATLRVP